LDVGAAREIVARALAAMAATDFQCVILDEHTIERPKCFVFFFQSDRYLRTGAVEDKLAGNGPGLVNRQTGELTFLWSGRSIDEQIAEFEAALEG
jgi:hypothetical protein